MDNKHLAPLFAVIQRSYAIDNHHDFFKWLQDGVTQFLPHDILVASWGDFNHNSDKAKLNYDVSSSLDHISTQVVFDSADEVDVCMRNLYSIWKDNNRCWFVINNLDSVDNQHPFKAKFPEKFQSLKSLMVYGVCDVRDGNECLYVFFSKNETFDVPVSMMGLIMPHIDSALRKIQHMAPLAVACEQVVALKIGGLSEREQEVIHWIKSGKTNQEIGLILDISQHTVKSHLKRIFQKLNVTRRAQAVALLSSQ